jgi:hypothetical protein
MNITKGKKVKLVAYKFKGGASLGGKGCNYLDLGKGKDP